MKKIESLGVNSLILHTETRYYVIDRDPKQQIVLIQSVDGIHTESVPYGVEVDVIAEAPRARGFEPVDAKFAQNVFPENGKYEVQMPIRKTARSSGYDFFAPADIFLLAKEVTIVPTNIKAFMMDDEELLLSIRSGLSTKGIMLMNAPGKIDSDYYENEDNDGNIGFIFYNMNERNYVIKKGDRIGQGTFYKYLIADDDNATGSRTGGMGSTGR